MNGQLYRLSAFADQPGGGNPAGVWIGEQLPDAAQMQRMAADVGYSETAFIAPAAGQDRQIRYFSPLAEVSFCGHATIASGVQLGQLSGPGRYCLHTAVGVVPVEVFQPNGQWQATLRSVATRHRYPPAELLGGVLAALGWHPDQLDPAIAPAIAYAGAEHLVIALKERADLDQMTYPFELLKSLMSDAGLTTLQLIWRESEGLFHARNPFPVGGVVEDPATGAAAAALGGYLRDAGLVGAPFALQIMQGVAMGRPSRLLVQVPVASGIEVSGGASVIADRD